MEVNGDGNCDELNKSLTSEAGIFSSETSSVLKSDLLLDKVGEVAVTLRPDGLSWEFLNDSVKGPSTCLGIKFRPDAATKIKFCDMYSVEFINYGSICGSNHISVGKHLLGCRSHNSEMFRFAVHGIQKSQSHPCVLVPATYTFGHVDLQACKIWIERIDASLKLEMGRPKSLLVFVNPRSGKSNGVETWDRVSQIFSRAKVQTKVIVTQRAGHAFDVMASMGNNELNSYDGFVTVGGDGFFNEMLNGFLLSRHGAPYPPSPSDLDQSDSEVSAPDLDGIVAETNCSNEDQSPLLSNSSHNRSKSAKFRFEDSLCNAADHDLEFPLERFRFGIIPAGSTDAIVMCTTGTRDPVTSALNIVMGKRLHLDIAQVVRWKATSTSKIEPFVRYAASFAGYGFYGDVITESEKYRWMGPKRYDYAGTKVFLKHRSYEAEVAYVESESEKSNAKVEKESLIGRIKGVCIPDKPERVICLANCSVCKMKPLHVSKKTPRSTPYSRPEGSKWTKCKGHFLSVGAAIMSNRNERAPDGLVADAHLSDGFLHLLLIRDCPRAHYLWHLTQLAKRGGKPLNFEFVEHHKTTAFTFTSFGDESVWNLDGELFPAHQLSAQVFRGLITLFASGPEV